MPILFSVNMDGMATYIALLLASLVIGVGAGSVSGRAMAKGKKYVSMAMTGLVFILILLMGLKTGSSEAVVSNLGVFGLQSLLITVATIAGSILSVLLFEKLVLKGVR